MTKQFVILVMVSKAMRNDYFFDNSLLSQVWKLAKHNDTSLLKVCILTQVDQNQQFNVKLLKSYPTFVLLVYEIYLKYCWKTFRVWSKIWRVIFFA